MLHCNNNVWAAYRELRTARQQSPLKKHLKPIGYPLVDAGLTRTPKITKAPPSSP
jgi:hypothetical protein